METNFTSNSNVAPKEQWLLRTTQNLIVGPFSKDEIKALILDGRLDSNDEVCQANDYWFSIYETDEVKNKLGIEVKTVFSKNATAETDEDTTETHILGSNKPIDETKKQEIQSAVESVNLAAIHSEQRQFESATSNDFKDEVTEPISNEIIRRNPALKSALQNRDPVLQSILAGAPKRTGSFLGFLIASVVVMIAMVFFFIKLKK